VVYRDRSADELRDIALARFEGGAWKTSPVGGDGWKLLGCPVNGPEIATEGSRIAVAWFTAAQNTARVEVAFSENAGATFSKPVRIDGGRPLGRVGLALDGNDAIVSWLEQTGETAQIRLRRVSADGHAGRPLDVAEVPATRATGVPRLARDGDRLVVAWTDPGAEIHGGTIRSGTLSLREVPSSRGATNRIP
jgi:hypothetical protein